MTEDREMQVGPDQVVKTAWVPIEDCSLVSRQGLHPVSVERAFRKYLQSGGGQFWPLIVGHWKGDKFVVCDGRHEFLALFMMDRERVLVAWIEEVSPSSDDISAVLDAALRHDLREELL